MKTWKNSLKKLLQFFFSVLAWLPKTSPELIFHIMNMSQDLSVYWSVALKYIFFNFSFFIQLTPLPFLETKFVPLAFSKYLKANVLRSERVVDTDELWYGNTVPSLACKYLHTWAEPPEYKQFRLGTNVYEVGIICPPLNEINFTKD